MKADNNKIITKTIKKTKTKTNKKMDNIEPNDVFKGHTISQDPPNEQIVNFKYNVCNLVCGLL